MHTRDPHMELPVPPQHDKIPTDSTQAIPIPPQHGDAYLQALRSLANDPRLPSPIFGGQKLAKEFEFAANALLTTVGINMKNVQEWAMLYSGATSHCFGVNSTNVQGPTNNDPSHRKITRWCP